MAGTPVWTAFDAELPGGMQLFIAAISRRCKTPVTRPAKTIPLPDCPFALLRTLRASAATGNRADKHAIERKNVADGGSKSGKVETESGVSEQAGEASRQANRNSIARDLNQHGFTRDLTCDVARGLPSDLSQGRRI
jgi:hypothetical protein